MVDAVLFDLDGTLLEYDFDAFLKRYFGLLAARATEGVPGVDLLPAMLASTQHTLGNDGSLTNQERFWQDFGPRIPAARADVERFIDTFYRSDFPSLKPAQPADGRPASAVTACRQRGLRTVLATNPIFPKEAVDERLRWAGLDATAFDLLTSFEMMHFCKPAPGYYREIADAIGVAPARCLMVGNDVAQDLVPAASVGMRTFLVANPFRVLDAGAFVPDHEGPLGAVPEVARGAERRGSA